MTRVVVLPRERKQKLFAVGRWPFPVGPSSDQLQVGRSYRHAAHTPILCLPSEDPCSASGTRRTLRGPSHHFLAEARKPFQGSSHGVFKDSPPSTSPCASRRPTEMGPEVPTSNAVPFLSFFPTSTVCSTQSFAGLLHPAADHGVRLVSSLSSTTEVAKSPDLPHKRLPFRAFPSTQAESRYPDIAAWFTETRAPLVAFVTTGPKACRAKATSGV